MDVVITCFDLHACGASRLAVPVVDGDLYIVCGSKAKVLGLATRQRIVKQLRDELEKCEAPQLHMSVVRLIVGDDHLSTEEAVQTERQQ